MTDRRKPLVAGNWKMNKLRHEAVDLALQLRQQYGSTDDVDIVLCPPFPWLLPVGEAIQGSRISLGAQNIHWEKQGAFTGEVSGGMLADAGCRYVIIGHSERRQFFAETNEMVGRKVAAALASGLLPIICVGETWAQRQAGETNALVANQVTAALSGLTEDQVRTLAVAYEPIWAIGTGHSASGDDAQEVAGLIREVVSKVVSAGAASSMRILYGGSVTPQNMPEFISQKDIDGALVGGASLKADSFSGIIEAAMVIAGR